jgi:hypothetical protein
MNPSGFFSFSVGARAGNSGRSHVPNGSHGSALLTQEQGHYQVNYFSIYFLASTKWLVMF